VTGIGVGRLARFPSSATVERIGDASSVFQFGASVLLVSTSPDKRALTMGHSRLTGECLKSSVTSGGKLACASAAIASPPSIFFTRARWESSHRAPSVLEQDVQVGSRSASARSGTERPVGPGGPGR